MKKHELRTDQLWSNIRQKNQSSQISKIDYEEWRTNPVTLRLFEELEGALITTQSTLASTHPSSPDIVFMQAQAYGESNVVESLFSWTPEGIKLHDDDWGSEGEGDTHE